MDRPARAHRAHRAIRHGILTGAPRQPDAGAPGSAIGRAASRVGAEAPWLLASAGALAYLIVAPPSRDLAAALYRAHLFSAHGLALWDGGWYAGHHLLAYGSLYPPLAAALGVRVVGALATVAGAWAFSRLAAGAWGAQGRAGAVWFGAGSAAMLLTGRLPFQLGVAIGLGALLAAQRGRRPLAGTLALGSTLASPVAGLFTALAGTAWWLASPPARGRALLVAAGGLLPLVALGLAFPEGGHEPFGASSFWPALGLTLAVGALAGTRSRALGVGALLYAALLVGAFAVPTPLGGNATRLGMLFAGPLAACALGGRGRWLLALALPLAYWQLVAPVRDVTALGGDRSVSGAYYRPLLAVLSQRSAGRPVRVEIPFTASHWEAYRVAPAFALARGWERQVDIGDNALFYRGRLTAERYRAWLAQVGVSYVAVPDVALDYSARTERDLIVAGPPYLTEVWRDAHWRLFAVRPVPALTDGAGSVTALGADGFALSVRAPGRMRVAERFSPYWAVLQGAGCVSRAPGGWTQLSARRAGPMRVGIRFAVGRIGAQGPRCSRSRR